MMNASTETKAPRPRRRSDGAARDGDGVALPEGRSATRFFYDVLTETAGRFPAAFESVRMPESAERFRADYAQSLVRFEAARTSSPDRAAIARFIVERAHGELRFREGSHESSLGQRVAEGGAPLAIERARGRGPGSLVPSVRVGARELRGAELLEKIAGWRAQHMLTDAAQNALRWVVDRAEQSGGALDLGGEKFVILGAGAELAPVRLLLDAGATVLWVDLVAPPDELARSPSAPGTLVFAPHGADLLARPADVARTIEVFADGTPTHIGMFAYAGGAAREWRLTAAMDAIVRALPSSLVASLAYYLSPTTPQTAQPEDIRAADARARDPRRWQSLLRMARLLPPSRLDRAAVCRAIVPAQGVSYQAAQYLGKQLSAEAYAAFGTTPNVERPLTVSANVAPMTRTRSLIHPIFETAFVGADAFDIEIFDPPTTRALSGLMMLHDVLNPAAPGASSHAYPDSASRARGLFSQQIHGGVYASPFALSPSISVALFIGLAREPKRLASLRR